MYNTKLKVYDLLITKFNFVSVDSFIFLTLQRIGHYLKFTNELVNTN